MINGNLKFGTGRESLIRAAIDVVAEEGLDGMSFRKVAKRAGLNNTLITHHFGTKESLLEAATEWAAERTQEMADVTATLPMDAGYAAALTRLVTTDPNIQIFQYYMLLSSPHSPELQRKMTKLYDTYIDGVAKALEVYGYGGDRPLARAIGAALDGLVLQQLTVSSAIEVEASIIRLGELLKPR